MIPRSEAVKVRLIIHFFLMVLWLRESRELLLMLLTDILQLTTEALSLLILRDMRSIQETWRLVLHLQTLQ